MSLIPAELRGPDVRQIRPEQTTSRRMLDLYRRALVIPGTPEQRIPGRQEQRIPGRPPQIRIDSVPVNLQVDVSQFRSLSFAMADSREGGGVLSFRAGPRSYNNIFQVVQINWIRGVRCVVNGVNDLVLAEFLNSARNTIFVLERQASRPSDVLGTNFITPEGNKSFTVFDVLNYNFFGERVISGTPETVIQATPDTIIPATPDRVEEGSVVTVAVARSSSIQVAGRSVINNGIAAIGAARLRLQGGRLYGVPVLARAASAPAAIAELRWILGGIPWWGGAWESALAGQWVRRAAWQDLARAVRYAAGLGTTRAVAVRETGNRVTTADFGAEEFLATDWELLDGNAEPAEVDVTDWVFSGSGGVPFAVVRSTSGGGDDPPVSINPPGGGAGPGLPSTGEGFVYLRNGTPTLVRARKLSDESIWRP